MHDLLAPALAAAGFLVLAACCLFGRIIARRMIAAAQREIDRREALADARALRILGFAAADRSAASADRGAALAYRRGVEATAPALAAAGWRLPRAVAVEVVPTPTIPCPPPDGAAEDSGGWVSMFAELDEPPSGVQPRHAATMLPLPPYQAPLRLPVFARTAKRAEQLEDGRDTPTTPKDPRS